MLRCRHQVGVALLAAASAAIATPNGLAPKWSTRPQSDADVPSLESSDTSLTHKHYCANVCARKWRQKWSPDESAITRNTAHPAAKIRANALGMVAIHMSRVKPRTHVPLSDGELEEGQLCEAWKSASHHRRGMALLCAVLDANNSQAYGMATSVTPLGPLIARWHSFDWKVHEVDRHNTSLSSHEAAPAERSR